VASGNEFIFEGTLDETAAKVQQLGDIAEEGALAIGTQLDEFTAEATRLKTELANFSGGGANAGEVDAAVAALKEEKVQIQQIAEANLANLDVMREATAVLAEQVLLQERLQGASVRRAGAATSAGGVVLPTGVGRRSTAGAATAGEQVAAEERAAIGASLLSTNAAAPSSKLIIPPSRSYGGTATPGEAAAAEQLAATEKQLADAEIARQAQLERNTEIIAQQNEELARQVLLIKQAHASAYNAGTGLARSGTKATAADYEKVSAAPSGLAAGAWAAEDAAIARTNLTLGQYDTYAADASLATNNLTAATLRMGAVQAEASNELRAHGALTTEYISALARGETTVNELGYQMGATIGKFAGWAGAAALTYGALGAVVEFGKGAIDTASAVQTLTRTIPQVNKQDASQQIGALAQHVNEPIAETGSAVFQASRTFHTLAGAVTAGGLALSAFKLDGVQVADSVKAMTAISEQYGLSASGLVPVFDQLAAGQQKYNARITDMIPLLQRAAGSVRNAGGSLTDLITLGQVALKTTQLSGSQVGTIFQRAASNYLSPNTPKGITDLSYLHNALGINTNVNFTDLVAEMIKRSATATPRERAGLATAFGGTGYGARGAALFGGEGAPLLASATKTNADAKGTLQVELAKALATPTQELHSFVIALQNLGGALSNTGAFTVVGALFKSMVDSVHGVTDLVNAFDKLSPVLKQVLSGVVELEAARLFVSRTRLGGSLAGFNKIPGFKPSQATRDRQDLALYNRPVITNLESDYGGQSAALIKSTTRQAQLQVQLAAIQRGELGPLEEGSAAMEASNAANAEMITLLDTQKTQLQQMAITKAALNEAQARQVSYTTSNRKNRISDVDAASQVAAVDAAGAEAGAAGAATGRSTGLIAYGSSKIGVLKASAAAQVASLRLLAAEELGVGASMDELAAESVAADAALVTAKAETVTAGVMLETTVASVKGFGSTLLGFAKGMDPLLVGMIALPIVYSSIKSSVDNMGTAIDDVNKAEGETITTIADVAKKAADLKAASQKAQSAGGNLWTNVEAGLGVVVNHFAPSVGDGLEGPKKTAEYKAELSGAQSKALTSTDKGLSTEVGQFKQFAAGAKDTPADMKEMGLALADYEHVVRNIATQGLSGFDPKDIKGAIAAADAKLKQYASQAKLGGSEGGDSTLQQVLQLSAVQQEDLIKYLDDYSKIYGAAGANGSSGGTAINQAIAVYAKIASEYGSNHDDASLTQLQTAQTNLAEAVNKNAEDLLASSDVATSYSGQMGDINAAGASLNSAKAKIESNFNARMADDKGHAQKIAADLAAESQLLDLLDTTFSTQLSDAVSAIGAQGALATSSIQGISPEADIARQQSTISMYKQELAKVQGNGPGAEKQRVAITAQLNDAQNSLASSQASNAASIVDAQGQLAQSSIIGLNPSLDITRATAAVTAAKNKLVQAETSGQGTAAILADQATLDAAQQTLLSTIQSTDATLAQNATSLIDAQSALAQSQTINPVTQAKQAAANAERDLKQIKPDQFATKGLYDAALKQGQAKVNSSRVAVTAAIASQDMDNLQERLATDQINDAQYVAGLEQILKMKKLAQTTRNQINTEIFTVNQSAAVDLNVGNIKLPTSYEVRAAMKKGLTRAAAAARGNSESSQPGVQTTTNNNIIVNIARDVDLHKFADILHKSTGATLTGRAQSMGMV
jgi:hypothetical protein